jgi:hypothetical protein
MTKASKKRHEVNREWKELNNEKPTHLYSSPNIKIEKNEMGRGMQRVLGEKRCIQGFGGET